MATRIGGGFPVAAGEGRSQEVSTMAMQRAQPTMMKADAVLGQVGSISQARANISAVPSTQWKMDAPSIPASRVTCRSRR